MDDYIFQNLMKSNLDYKSYFYPEIKQFVDNNNANSTYLNELKEIEKKMLEYDQNIFDNFDSKCQTGENDSQICNLIRNDSIDEFIGYINKQIMNYQVLSNFQFSKQIHF